MKDLFVVAKSSIRALAWIALAVVAIILAALAGAFGLSYIPPQWQSQVALMGSLLILVLAITIAVIQRRRRDPRFIDVIKKVGLSFSGGFLLFVGAWALLFLVLVLVLPT